MSEEMKPYSMMRDGELLREIGTDARKWADAFHSTALALGHSDMDRDWLTTWFANALTARPSGGDEVRKALEGTDALLEAMVLAIESGLLSIAPKTGAKIVQDIKNVRAALRKSLSASGSAPQAYSRQQAFDKASAAHANASLKRMAEAAQPVGAMGEEAARVVTDLRLPGAVEGQVDSVKLRAAKVIESLSAENARLDSACSTHVRTIMSMQSDLAKAETRIRELEAAQGTGEAAAKFVRWAMREGAWDGSGLDGGEIQDKAEELGLIVRVPYDPEKHGESEFDVEAGDDWFVFAGPLAAPQAEDEKK